MSQKEHPPRYTYEEVAIPKKEAVLAKKESIEYLKYIVRVAKSELRDAKRSPLQLTKTVQTTMHHGDKGYDEAPIQIYPHLYQGNMRWARIDPKTKS